MFYTLIKIIAVNAFILSTSLYVPKKKKFTSHLIFKEVFCEGLLTYTKLTAITEDLHHRVKFIRASYVICK